MPPPPRAPSSLASWSLAAIVGAVLMTGLGARAQATPSAPPDDDGAARTLAAMAAAGLEARHPEQAAELFDRAFAIDPHPLWRVAAAEAWLEAIEPARAAERLAAALSDERLVAVARARAAETLTTARALAPIVERARRAEAAGAWVEGARAWDEAYALLPHGRVALFAGRAAERAADLVSARRHYERAAARGDLASDEERALAAARARLLAVPEVPAEDDDELAPLVLVSAGGVALAVGAAALVTAEDADAELHAMKATAVDGVVRSATRAEAAALHDRAATWSTVGWVTLGAGALAAAVGITWLATAPEPAQSGVQVTATPARGGLRVDVRAAF